MRSTHHLESCLYCTWLYLNPNLLRFFLPTKHTMFFLAYKHNNTCVKGIQCLHRQGDKKSWRHIDPDIASNH